MPGHPITKYEDTPISGLPVNVPNGICGLDGTGQVAPAQLGNAVLDTEVGAPGGVASLDGGGQVPVAQLPSPLPGVLTIAAIVKTDGVGAYVPIPGTLIPFTVGVAGICSFWAAGVFTGVVAITTVSLNFRIDGVDFAPQSFGWFGAGGAFMTAVSLTPHISLPLTAGPHTVELVGSVAFGMGLNASPGTPLTLSVLFP